MSTLPEDLRKLCEDILKDPSTVENLTEEQLTELRKRINPYGGNFSASKKYANVSIINWRDAYLRRLHMTALIGYLYRLVEEYVPEAEADKKYTESEVKETRALIRRFLDSNFSFNPDKHLREAHTENSADPERENKNDYIRRRIGLKEEAARVDEKLASKPEDLYKYVRQLLLQSHHAAVEAREVIKSAISVLSDPHVSADDKQGILLKKYAALKSLTEDSAKLVNPISAAETINALLVNPPADVYYHFDRYLSNNYEALVDIVRVVYNEKNDFEHAIILYDCFDKEEDAIEHRRRHAKEFKFDVFTIQNGAPTILGPFNENRKRIDYYNKNTEVIKQLMDQVERDHKIGKELMEKKVKVTKRKNILEAGPDAPGLTDYIKAMNTVEKLGAKRGLTEEEAKELAEAKQRAEAIKESFEVPDDAIQVDVFHTETDPATGERVMKRSKFYTQAEAPQPVLDQPPDQPSTAVPQ